MEKFKNILITGASSGIGQALALQAAAPGVTLMLCGRNQARLEDTAAACRTKGATAHICTIDLEDREALTTQINDWDKAQPIDLVIANAGISGGSSGGAGFQKILSVNLHGTLHTIEPLIPHFQARRRGQIALVSSMAGWRGMPNAPAYSVSKMAVRAYGEALRPLLKKQGIGVSVIFPGFVKTPLTDVNDFPMPLLMSPEKAAACIYRGLARNKARIGFPWVMMTLSRLIAALPLCLGDFLLSRAPKKPE